MYSPPHFEQLNIDAMQAFIRDYPLATVVSYSCQNLEANHIPLQLRRDDSPYGRLVGHIARANPLGKLVEPSVEVLVIFHGPESYISPNWYATRHETGRVVPTWNYAVVHAYGNLRVIDDPSWILVQLDELTAAHEQAMPNPWKIGDAPVEFTERLINEIVGIEISITRLCGKWKVSQNQPEINQLSVVAGLESQGSDKALAMAKLIGSGKFNK